MELDTAQWIDHQVGTDIANALNAFTVSEGRHYRWGFTDALKAWHSHVAKLTADLESPIDAPGLWGPHDLLAALIFRSKLEQGLNEIPQQHFRTASAALDEVDRAYLAFTEPDDCGCVGRVDTDVPSDDGWWWARIPEHGLIRMELERYYGHPRSSTDRP